MAFNLPNATNKTAFSPQLEKWRSAAAAQAARCGALVADQAAAQAAASAGQLRVTETARHESEARRQLALEEASVVRSELFETD